MKIDITYLFVALAIVLFIGILIGSSRSSIEKFEDFDGCNVCHKPNPCGCQKNNVSDLVQLEAIERQREERREARERQREDRLEGKECAPCPVPDNTKYVLKSSVPPCPPMPDMSRYMLKTECPSIPDMSKYVLKTSIPSCPPCISTCSKPCKIGDCPPCPRPRCPAVNCPEPKACPACPAASCAPCPEPDIKCKASYEPSYGPRPMLASTSTFGF